MRAGLIILPEPSTDDRSGLLDWYEPFRVGNFPVKRPVESFIISVLPRAFVAENAEDEAAAADLNAGMLAELESGGPACQ